MLRCRTLCPQETQRRDSSVGGCDVTLHVMKVVVPFDTVRAVGTPVREPQEQEDGHLAGLFGLRTHCRRLCVSQLVHRCVMQESHTTNINRDFLL
jgi:hypothetical protein